MTELADAIARGLVTGAVYGLIVLPFIFLWRSTRVICLSQAQISIFAALITINVGANFAGAGLALAIGLGLGIVTYAIAVFPVRRHGDEDFHGTLVSTLALGLLIQALLLAVYGGLAQVGSTPFGSPEFTLFTGTSFSYYSWGLVALCLLAGIGASLFLSRSDLGVQWRAIGDDRILASVRGIRVTRMELICFVVGGVASAAVGFLVASQLPIRADAGLGFALKAFLVMGFVGLDRPWAGAVGGLALGVGEAILLDHVTASLTSVLLVGALIVWLLMKGGVSARAVREF